MTRYAVDAPTLLHLVASGLRVDGAHQIVATNAVRSQALQLLLEEVRAGRLTEQEAMDRHDRITELKMRLLGDRVSRRTAWRLALDRGLSIGAAEVLAVATLQADALVTGDSELASTASDVVRLASLDDLTSP